MVFKIFGIVWSIGVDWSRVEPKGLKLVTCDLSHVLLKYRPRRSKCILHCDDFLVEVNNRTLIYK